MAGRVDVLLAGALDARPKPLALPALGNVGVAGVSTVSGDGGGQLYGPTGSEWFTFLPTPTMAAPITTTIALNDYTGLNSAIAAHKNDLNVVIALANGTWSGGSSHPINAVSGLETRTQNILIRPETIGGVTFSAPLRVYAASISIAHFVGAGWYAAGQNSSVDIKTARFGAANNVIDKDIQLITRTNKGECVGNVVLNRSTGSGDRHQLVVVDYHDHNNWWEGRDTDLTISPHPHVDNHQFLGASGVLSVKNSYFGGGGNTCSFFFKEDSQGGMSQPAISLDTVWAGLSPQGSDDLMILLYDNGQTLSMNKVVCERNLRLRTLQPGATSWDPTWVPTTITNCRAQVYALLRDSDGGTLQLNPTPGVALGTSTRPVFAPPTWWNHAWDTL